MREIDRADWWRRSHKSASELIDLDGMKKIKRHSLRMMAKNLVDHDRMHTPEMAGSGQRGVCVHCRLGPTKEGHDGCLGTLPNVMNACCGHGRDSQAYVQFWNGECVRGGKALCLMKR